MAGVYLKEKCRVGDELCQYSVVPFPRPLVCVYLRCFKCFPRTLSLPLPDFHTTSPRLASPRLVVTFLFLFASTDVIIIFPLLSHDILRDGKKRRGRGGRFCLCHVQPLKKKIVWLVIFQVFCRCGFKFKFWKRKCGDETWNLQGSNEPNLTYNLNKLQHCVTNWLG